MYKACIKGHIAVSASSDHKMFSLHFVVFKEIHAKTLQVELQMSWWQNILRFDETIWTGDLKKKEKRTSIILKLLTEFCQVIRD